MATLRELADCTGFSITTISRVLNDDPTMGVSDSTRATILEAAGRLHYQSTSRRAKALQTPPLLLAVAEMLSPVEQLSDPYYLYLKNYAEQHCRDLGYAITHLVEQPDGYQLDASGKVDGILAIGIFSGDQINDLAKISQNIVFLDSSPDELHFDSVVLDFKLGIEQAVDYLLSKGHREIGFIGPFGKLDQLKRPAPEVRRQYFTQYMQGKGLFDRTLLLESPMTAVGARGALTDYILSGKRLPTAIIAANEEVAIGTVHAVRKAGLSIPRDLSIISFNDTALSALTDPPLTSISTHVEAMSTIAVDFLVRRCTESSDFPPMKVVVSPSLAERESVLIRN